MAHDETTEWQRISLSPETSDAAYLEVIVRRGGREDVGFLDSIPVERVTETVTAVAKMVRKALEQALPNKAVVELGLEFGMQEGQLVALIARGSGKANLKISLEWNRAVELPPGSPLPPKVT